MTTTEEGETAVASAPAPPRRRRGSRPRPHRPPGWHLASLVLVVVVWEVASVALGKTPSGTPYVPGLQDVFKAFKSFAGYWPGGLGAGNPLDGAPPTAWGAVLGLVYNTGVSLIRVIGGYAIGVVVGVGLGLLVSWSAGARAAVSLPAHLLRMVPLLAMLPLFGLWFGASEIGTYAFTGFAVAALMLVVTINAVERVSDYYIHYAASLGASPGRIYRTVVVPASLPQLGVGLQMSVPFAWSAVLASEILGKQHGLGRILNFALLYASTNIIAACGFVVVVVAAASYFSLRRFLRWCTRWS